MNSHSDEYQVDAWERAYAKLFCVIVYLAIVLVGIGIGKDWANLVRQRQFWNHARKYAPLIAMLLVYMAVLGLWKDAISRWRSRSRLNQAIVHTIPAAVTVSYLNHFRGDPWYHSALFVLCLLGMIRFAAGLGAEWPAPGTRVRSESSEPQH